MHFFHIRHVGKARVFIVQARAYTPLFPFTPIHFFIVSLLSSGCTPFVYQGIYALWEFVGIFNHLKIERRVKEQGEVKLENPEARTEVILIAKGKCGINCFDPFPNVVFLQFRGNPSPYFCLVT